MHCVCIYRVIMSTLTVSCRWEDQMGRESAGHPPSYAEAEKMTSPTRHLNSCLSGWLLEYKGLHSSSTFYSYFLICFCFFLYLSVCLSVSISLSLSVCRSLCLYISIYTWDYQSIVKVACYRFVMGHCWSMV